MEQSKFHLSSWKSLSLPKRAGGWDLKHLGLFILSLCAKSLWRGIFGSNLWSTVINQKYIKTFFLADWFREPVVAPAHSSPMWKNLLKSLPIIKHWISWKVGQGIQVMIGIDPIVGFSGNFILSHSLMGELKRANIEVLCQIKSNDS